LGVMVRREVDGGLAAGERLEDDPSLGGDALERRGEQRLLDGEELLRRREQLRSRQEEMPLVAGALQRVQHAGGGARRRSGGGAGSPMRVAIWSALWKPIPHTSAARRYGVSATTRMASSPYWR